MRDAYCIETSSGVIQASSSALAEALAELLESSHRATERDLDVALRVSLTDEEPGASSTGIAAA